MRYWWKIVDFNLPGLYLATHWGWPHWTFVAIFGIKKLWVPVLSYGGIFVILCFVILVQCRIVTDRWTALAQHRMVKMHLK